MSFIPLAYFQGIRNKVSRLLIAVQTVRFFKIFCEQAVVLSSFFFSHLNLEMSSQEMSSDYFIYLFI